MISPPLCPLSIFSTSTSGSIHAEIFSAISALIFLPLIFPTSTWGSIHAGFFSAISAPPSILSTPIWGLIPAGSFPAISAPSFILPTSTQGPIHAAFFLRILPHHQAFSLTLLIVMARVPNGDGIPLMGVWQPGITLI